jgi:hypothetical protein
MKKMPRTRKSKKSVKRLHVKSKCKGVSRHMPVWQVSVPFYAKHKDQVVKKVSQQGLNAMKRKGSLFDAASTFFWGSNGVGGLTEPTVKFDAKIGQYVMTFFVATNLPEDEIESHLDGTHFGDTFYEGEASYFVENKKNYSIEFNFRDILFRQILKPKDLTQKSFKCPWQ